MGVSFNERCSASSAWSTLGVAILRSMATSTPSGNTKSAAERRAILCSLTVRGR
jgi:hypothetical protein